MTTTGAIGRTLDNMATDHDIDSILSTSDTFCEAPEIPYSSPIEDITRAIAEYSKSGVPCVITGLPSTADDEQSPFHKSTEWVESIYNSRGRPFCRSRKRFL